MVFWVSVALLLYTQIGYPLVLAVAARTVRVPVTRPSGATPTVSLIIAAYNEGAVIALLKGIPQNGNTLGNPNAPVTITEYGDLVCPVCKDFALGPEQQIITSLVRTGNAKLVYRGYETASQTANNGEYAASQIAARAAGLQQRAWQYILLWYNEQGDETTPYVTDAYMQGLAQQVPGLKLATWQADRNNAALANAVTADGQAATAAGAGGTPAVFFTGSKGTVQYTASAFPTLAQSLALVTQVR